MIVGGYLTGIHPRSERLIELTRALDRKRASEAEVEEQYLKETRSLIELQNELGFTHLIDGLLNWQDLLRPFTSGLEAIEVGPLTRWFNNNTFYRKPLIIGRIKETKDRIIEPKRYLRTDLFPGGGRMKAVLPAPYTFGELVEDKFYRDRVKLMEDYADVLNKEAKQLVNDGVSYIQFSDPCLVYGKGRNPIDRRNLKDAGESLQIATEGLRCEKSLQTYFGDCAAVMAELLDFPVDCIGIDFYETKIESLEDYTIDKAVACGCVDGRNSLVESPEDIASFAVMISEKLELEKVFLCPNCDLEFLPFDVAVNKMRSIGESLKKLGASSHA